MSYIVNRSDGNIAAVVNDGVINTTTSLNLVGKGYPNYAETVAEDLVSLLENHAGVIAPRNPLPGQLWYNKSTRLLQIYDEVVSKFKPINNVVISNTAPTEPSIGDLWYHSTKRQLFFYKVTYWQLLGPSYAFDQGQSELVVESFGERGRDEHTVITFFNKGKRVVVISSDPQFDTFPIIPGFETVFPGINIASEYSNILGPKIMNGTSRRALEAGGLDPYADLTYMRANADAITIGNITSYNQTFTLGENSNFIINTKPHISLTANVDSQITLKGYHGASLTLDNSSTNIGINKLFPTADLDIGGSLKVDSDISLLGNINLSSVTGTIGTYNGAILIDVQNQPAATFEVGHITLETDTEIKGNLTADQNTTFTGNVSISSLPSVATDAANKTYVDQLTYNNLLPIGSIILWYGNIATVPNGWNICNGEHGTPDLRDRFVMGAGSLATPNDIGGNNTVTITTTTVSDHNHSGTVNSGGDHDHGGYTGGHTLTANELGPHSHNYSDLYGLRDDAQPPVYDRNGNRLQEYTGWGNDNDNDSGSPIFRDWQTDEEGGGAPHTHPIGNSGTHVHTFTSNSAGSHNHSVINFDNRPNWYALFYIMKTSNSLIPV
jgi:hypothetical protein